MEKAKQEWWVEELSDYWKEFWLLVDNEQRTKTYDLTKSFIKKTLEEDKKRKVEEIRDRIKKDLPSDDIWNEFENGYSKGLQDAIYILEK